MQYSRPRQNLTKLEDQIKKFICGKFEEERITQVKKTTNWNINISSELRNVLSAANEITDDYEFGVKDAFDPERQRKRRGQKNRRDNGDPDFNPHTVPFQKYFVDL